MLDILYGIIGSCLGKFLSWFFSVLGAGCAIVIIVFIAEKVIGIL